MSLYSPSNDARKLLMRCSEYNLKCGFLRADVPLRNSLTHPNMLIRASRLSSLYPIPARIQLEAPEYKFPTVFGRSTQIGYLSSYCWVNADASGVNRMLCLIEHEMDVLCVHNPKARWSKNVYRNTHFY